MVKTHDPYPAEFRAEAVRLVRTSGRPATQIARELELGHDTLRRWMRRSEADAHQDGLNANEAGEIKRLLSENKRLREEHEILVKAAAFFARETGQNRT